jgi:crossover junction endodeoxyribonuclease RuvC
LIICGIDPGLDGGLAILDDSGQLVGLHLMPTIKAGRKGCRGGKAEIDMAALARLLVDNHVGHVCLERVSAMKGWGAGSAWRFGVGWGQIQGLTHGLGLGLVLVPPKTWQSKVLSGTTRDKGAAIAYVLRRWPGVDLKPGKRTKHHDGLADAACIAEYGLPLIGGKARIIVPTPPPTTIPD